VAGLVIANLVILIIWRPYKQSFHNFAIIFNNTVLIFVLAISVVMIIRDIPDDLELIWAYIVMGSIFLMECFACVRIYMAAKKTPKENQRMNRVNENEDELKKGMEIMEK
jgi:hypothetical protein